MQLGELHTPVSNSNPNVQAASPLTGFKFLTIGQNPSLLQRMSDIPQVPLHSPSMDQKPFQERVITSRGRSRPSLLQHFATGSASVERDGSTKLTSASPNDTKFPPFHDHIHTSIIPDLQYPIAPRDVERASVNAHERPSPMDQDTPYQLPVPRNAASVPLPATPGGGTGVTNGPPDNPNVSLPSASSQQTRATTSSEPEQVRRPVEHLIKLASARDDQLSKLRKTFEHRSGELSTFSTDALHAAQAVQDRIEPLKQLAEETRVQAEKSLQEANKARDMSERLMASAEALSTDMLTARNHLSRAMERSEQMTRFVLKSFFDRLATLRTLEQEKIELVEAELAEQAAAAAEAAARCQRMEELQRQLGRRKAEEQEKKEAAKREQEEREAARKREESEAARKKSYDEQRAAVMEEKRRANEAHAQSIQAEREKRVADASESSPGSSVRGSNAPVRVSPRVASDFVNSGGISTPITRVPSLPSQASSRLPVTRISGASEAPSHPQPSLNKTSPASVCFVPAQTDVGRAVNTDSPLSSTILASELHPRTISDAPQYPRFSQPSRETAQERMQNHMPERVESRPEWQRVEIKREPSVEELPAGRMQLPLLQPSLDVIDTIDRQHWQQITAHRTSTQDKSRDQYAQVSSTSESRADSLQAAQPVEPHHRSYPSAPMPSQEGGPVHFQDSLHNRVVPATDVRAYDRQDSVSSRRSPSPWNDRRRRSPSPSYHLRRLRSRSRSPPYPRKRARSGTPRHDGRQAVDRWEPPRPRDRPRPDYEWPRGRNYYDHDRVSQADSPRHYRAVPSRRVNYRQSPSPPPSPRVYRPERSPPGHDYRDRLPAAGYDPRPFADMDVRERRTEEHRMNVDARHYGPSYEEAETRRTAEKEQGRWQQQQQQQRQRPTPSPSEREQSPTPPPPRTGEAEVGLLDRIDMNETDDRGRGRGRPPPGTIRGGPNSRRGVRGGFSGGRGRGSASGPTPKLLSRMSETTMRPTHVAPAPSLSDRMQQD